MDLRHGDCLEVLKDIESNSIDSLVADPPAGIGFMGKNWDSDKGGRHMWVRWMTEVMIECLRVMKPGAHGLVWSLPRTSHWTATALEDAGFEIRDCVYHLFGSGFPKSLDVSKAIDKAAGAKREIVGHADRKASLGSKGVLGTSNLSEAPSITAPATDVAKQWAGFGTALKPAVECWWVVRKPISEKTVSANVLKWGTGALNIDASRVGSQERPKMIRTSTVAASSMSGTSTGATNSGELTTQGRFPANLILSHSPHCMEDQCDIECAIAMLDEQSGVSKSSGGRTVKRGGKYVEGKVSAPGKWTNEDPGFGDVGGASRFFYCAKVSSSERNAGLEGAEAKRSNYRKGDEAGRNTIRERLHNSIPKANHHPTVKPQKLMRYLCKLVTPPGGAVLDPFMGSGSTGLAAKSEGFRFIGIEREQEYLEIAEKRIGT